MSTRRRVGFNTSTSEASRRQLMQPVPCWEKVWALPENAAPGSTLKVYKWVRTDKKQQFSDDEEETDQPLAPLPEPDDVEVVEGDDEIDQDEMNASQAPDTASRDVSEAPLNTPITPNTAKDNEDESKPSTPKPHPLSISFTPGPDTEVVLDDALDASLKPVGGLGESLDGIERLGDVGEELGAGMEGMEGMEDLSGDMELSLEGMGPDGEPFEGVGAIEQLQGGDALLGGGLMTEGMEEDPFAVPPPA